MELETSSARTAPKRPVRPFSARCENHSSVFEAVVFETVFAKDASGEGLYPFVTHSFADAEKGAVGIIQVGTPKVFATMSH